MKLEIIKVNEGIGTAKMSSVVTARAGVIKRNIELSFAVLAGSEGLDWFPSASN